MQLIKPLLSLLLLINLTTSAGAQSAWFVNPNTEQATVSADWSKPNFGQFVNNNYVTTFSSVLFIQGYVPVNDNFAFIADIPISHWGYNDNINMDIQDPHTTIGNIYIGGVYKFNDTANGRFSQSVEIGTRLSTMPEPDFPDERGLLTGFLSSIDRKEAFTPDVVPFFGLFNGDYKLNTVVTLSFTGGATYWTNVEDLFRDNQLFLMQRLMVHFDTNELGGRLGLSGKYNVAPGDGLLSDLDITQVWAGVNKTFSDWTIEAYVRSPLTNSDLRRAIGVKASFAFNP
jgi:hypothetical protein